MIHSRPITLTAFAVLAWTLFAPSVSGQAAVDVTIEEWQVPNRAYPHDPAVAPDGSAIVPSSKPQPDGALMKALARAWRWQKLLDEDCYTGIAELAAAERISRSYVCRILRLTLLAPDIVERILDGRPTAAASP